MAERSQYSDEVRAKVLAALLSGQGIEAVAAEYQIPRGTIKSWRSRMNGGGHALQPVATQTQAEISELLLDYLRESLRTLRSQVEFFRDVAWLAKQDASEAAVLHGVLTDKTVRLLEALQAGADSEREAIPTTCEEVLQ